MEGLLIHLFVLCVIFGALFYALSFAPLPQPWANFARLVLVLLFVVILLGWIAPIGSGWPVYYRRTGC